MEPQTQPLVCPSHTKQYIGVVILGILFGVGIMFVYIRQVPQSIGNSGYQQGFDDAKKLVLESPMGMMFSIPNEIYAVSGVVTEVKGNRITIHTESQNPFYDKSFADRVVSINNDTKITKFLPGNNEAFQIEMQAFMKKIQAGKNSSTPPTPPIPLIVIVSVSDIKVGDAVTATTQENIKTVPEFTAS
jgi:hypothetical protein